MLRHVTSHHATSRHITHSSQNTTSLHSHVGATQKVIVIVINHISFLLKSSSSYNTPSTLASSGHTQDLLPLSA